MEFAGRSPDWEQEKQIFDGRGMDRATFYKIMLCFDSEKNATAFKFDPCEKWKHVWVRSSIANALTRWARYKSPSPSSPLSPWPGHSLWKRVMDMRINWSLLAIHDFRGIGNARRKHPPRVWTYPSRKKNGIAPLRCFDSRWNKSSIEDERDDVIVRSADYSRWAIALFAADTTAPNDTALKWRPTHFRLLLPGDRRATWRTSSELRRGCGGWTDDGGSSVRHEGAAGDGWPWRTAWPGVT